MQALSEAFMRNDKNEKPIEPYGGFFGFVPAFTAGVAEGIPSVVGGTISGAGTLVKGMGYVTPAEDDVLWNAVGSVMQRGGNWIQENIHLTSQETRDRIEATKMNPLFEDDGRPAWKIGSWFTGEDGEWNLGKRMAEVAAKTGAGIGETVPLVASLALPGGALKLAGAGQKLATFGGAASALGGMVALQTNEGMKQLEKYGYDTDTLEKYARIYGAASGPVEYVQAMLSSKLMRGAIEKAGGKNVGRAISDTVERLLSENTKMGAAKAAGIE
jgi:hypothetical protein